MGIGHHHHEHGPGCGHGHAPVSFGRMFAVGIGLNSLFVLVEGVFGVAGHSTALLADAGHNLSDVLGLVVAWAAVMLAKRGPTVRFTYGFGQGSILAALFNSLFLLVVVGMIAWEAIGRFWDPEPVAGGVMMAVAGVGIAVNGLTAWLLTRGGGGAHKHDLNVRGAYLHMLGDAAVSAGVVVAGLVISLTGWLWLDPVVTLVIAGLIVWGTWGLLRHSLDYSMGGVPAGVDMEAVKGYLAGLGGVEAVHDLHIWPLSTQETALTCHLVMPTGHPGDGVLMAIAARLRREYRISHATLQVEMSGEGCNCPLHAA